MSLSKSLFILLTLLLTSSGGSRQTTVMLYNDRQEILKGKVKRLIQTGLNLRGSPFWFRYSDTVCFNNMREQTTESSGWSDGLHWQIDFNSTYEDGHKSLQLPYPRALGKREYEFDNDGHLTEASYYNEFGFFEKRTFSYNSEGQLVEVNWYDKKNVLRQNERLNYRDGFISADSFSKYKYLGFDKHGNWIKRASVEKGVKDKMTTNPDTVINSSC